MRGVCRRSRPAAALLLPNVHSFVPVRLVIARGLGAQSLGLWPVRDSLKNSEHRDGELASWLVRPTRRSSAGRRANPGVRFGHGIRLP